MHQAKQGTTPRKYREKGVNWRDAIASEAGVARIIARRWAFGLMGEFKESACCRALRRRDELREMRSKQRPGDKNDHWPFGKSLSISCLSLLGQLPHFTSRMTLSIPFTPSRTAGA